MADRVDCASLGLFEHDDAIKHALFISKDIAQDDPRRFAHLLAYTLSGCPEGVGDFYAQEYKLMESLVPEMQGTLDILIRYKLDSGLGDELFAKYRALETGDELADDSRLRTVILGAIMMRHGAKIEDDDAKHLREIVDQIYCSEILASLFLDNGLRGPGKRQFLAALDHYKAGKPRDFLAPSCHNCSKVNEDIKADGKVLMKCGKCENQIAAAWFCDKVCAPLARSFSVTD